MPRIAYLDIIGGISGDMLLAAIIDAGVPQDKLKSELAKVISDRFQILVTKAKRGSITATHVDIREVSDSTASRWGWEDFRHAYENSTLPKTECDAIASIFSCLKQAEAEAHGANAGSTHLHELGTLDTIADVAGAVIGLRLLGVEKVYSSPLPASIGISSSSHGISASIAPATMSIIRNRNIPMRVSGNSQPSGESITPTGAATVASIANFQPIQMRIDSVGYGAGSRNSDNPPNVLGLWVGDSTHSEPVINNVAQKTGTLIDSNTALIETNLDDMTGEQLGHAMNHLLDVGAIDVWMTPIQMKKSRPGVVLSVLLHRRDMHEIASIIFNETTTLGLRMRHIERLVAERDILTVATRFGDVRVKVKKLQGKIMQVSPEYEDCARISSETGLSLINIMKQVQSDADDKLLANSIDYSDAD